MRVRTNLLLFSAFFIILLVAFGLIMLQTSDRVNREVRESNAASEIIKDVSELNTVTYEYLTYHEERMYQQWLLKYDSLGRLLEEMAREEAHPEHLSTLQSIASDYEALGGLFSEIQANLAKRRRSIEQNGPRAQIELSFALERRLAAQALMRSQRIATEAFQLSTMTQQRVARIQQRANSIALVSIVGFGILSFCISFLATTAITRPLSELARSAEIIGKGDLKHRVEIKSRNEIGELAAAFNQMTERRQRAEQALEEYSERLEHMVEERTRELQEAQERLIRREKLAVLGQLAGGVGHELRNPLSAIKSGAYFLNMVLDNPEPEVKETLEILERETEISESIISSLLDFARPKPPSRHAVDVNKAIRDALARTDISQEIEVLTQLEPLPPVPADPTQIGQVFANIILNAIQAMPEGGRLAIRSEVVDSRCVSVYFADTGVGIPEENLERIFEPLFTTKARGIGLGLALAKTLVESHGGTIEAESHEREGSTFTVRLPINGWQDDRCEGEVSIDGSSDA